MRARLLSLTLLVLLAACASAGGGGGGGGNSNLLTAQDIQTNAISAGESLYDLVQRIRPQWFQSRMGQAPVVFIDGSNAGNLQALRTVNAGNVQEARYLLPEAAASRFGGGFEGGVIEVTLRQ